MTTVTLSTFPLPDRDETYWQVFIGGMPVTRETTDQAAAIASFRRIVDDQSTHGRKVQRAFWDGFHSQTTVLS